MRYRIYRNLTTSLELFQEVRPNKWTFVGHRSILNPYWHFVTKWPASGLWTTARLDNWETHIEDRYLEFDLTEAEFFEKYPEVVFQSWG